MGLLSGLVEKVLREQAKKLAKKQARKAYATKCAQELNLYKGDVERVLDWLVDKI